MHVFTISIQKEPRNFIFVVVCLFAVQVTSLTSRYSGHLFDHKTKRNTRFCSIRQSEKMKDVVNYLEYVDPSISDVLMLEPDDISDVFLQTKNTDGANLVFIDAKKCTINWSVFEEYIIWKILPNEVTVERSIPMDVLVTLAAQCELAIFRENGNSLNLPLPIEGLINMAEASDSRNAEEDEAHILIATLIALNMVESSTRHLTGKEHGRAPLLKDMIEIIAKSEDGLPFSLAAVLQSLLLPNDGINLRNLLWHGFLPSIKRQWFALSIVLTLSMDDLAGSSSFGGQLDENLEGLQSMRKHKSLESVLDHGQGIRLSRAEVQRLERQLLKSPFIPASHKSACRIALQYLHCPVIFASVTGPLVEHSLRLWWCDANSRNDSIARPGSYYVTLDGHGQRDKHDIVLLPFLSQDENVACCPDDKLSDGARNKLVYRLGGATMALLIDLFASPPGAPNIRASVAHGLFNKYLFEELQSMNTGDGHNTPLDDMTNALLSVLDILSSNDTPPYNVEGNSCQSKPAIALLDSYRPLFSYSALLLHEVDNLVTSLEPFYSVLASKQHLGHASNESESAMQRDVTSTMKPLGKDFDTIATMRDRIYEKFGADKSSQWTVDNAFRESSNNLIASECVAARLLLSEVAIAASSSLNYITTGLAELQCTDNPPSSRRRKQIYRICSVVQLTLDFYSFAAFCALLYVERRVLSSEDEVIYPNLTDDVIFLAVKRSRMVVSTFSTANMLDRALKAVQQYAIGKAVKVIGKEMANVER